MPRVNLAADLHLRDRVAELALWRSKRAMRRRVASSAARLGTILFRQYSPLPHRRSILDDSSLYASSERSANGDDAKQPHSTRACACCGKAPANMRLNEPPWENPNSAARSEPAASITARTSSIRSSSVATPATRSDRPVPRLSNRIRRENAARREKWCAHSGSSQNSSI